MEDKYIVPPMQAPIANAQMSGCSGKFKAFFSANEIVTFSIIVVNGILSTNADAIADTQSMINIATVKRLSSPTTKIMFSACDPIHSMRPSSDSASISTNNAAKNNNVDHSTRAKTASMSCRSDSIKSRTAPSSAVQPSDNR